MNKIHYDQGFQASRWIGYFDLLGTADLIRSGKINEVFGAYQEAFEQLERWRKRHANVDHAWFSDTFIVYSENDSEESFCAIEMVCRWLAFSLLRQKIPLRGALACGGFYADRKNSLYLGVALSEAYEWGENQDWIGYILCPSSVERLDELNIPVKERLNYVEYAVPFKKQPTLEHTRIGACILDNMMRQSDGASILLPTLKEMAEAQTDPRIQSKYERTIEFLVKNERKWIPKEQ